MLALAEIEHTIFSSNQPRHDVIGLKSRVFSPRENQDAITIKKLVSFSLSGIKLLSKRKLSKEMFGVKTEASSSLNHVVSTSARCFAL